MNLSLKIKVCALLAVALYIPSNVFAWGITGHRVVGKVAEYYLSAKARKAVKGILGNEDMAMASNWMDFIKSDTSFNYLNSWHYVNLAAGLDQNGVFGYLDSFNEASLYSKIPEQIAVLKNEKSSAGQKLMALRILIHLMGDLHQPMHTARKEDLGGNKVNVTWFGQRSNLHRVWDEGLVDYQQLSYTEYATAINHPAKEQLSKWKAGTLKDYIYESYVACNKIYAFTKAEDKLSYNYNFEFVGLLNEQLLKGGIRLAVVLNDIYR
ncbi:S1/P1 nuclease [Pedobacter sp. MC2016-14]|uniref:S1/P1 nuclease n=1 Tax=Pedobacter sp. MC2016-14 TaxID=2897327 RepID=UPI001E47FAF5|nr:S1/P1 nuclease [Pedobacter sp. MC2016-14]MCD0487087.1 S1/P1 nuclease [Pedobacter sp. MC2016-14]